MHRLTETATHEICGLGTYYTCPESRSKINESVSLRASTTMEWGESICIRIPFWWWPGAAISPPSAWVREYNQSLWPRWTDRPEDQQKEDGGNDSERKSEQTERIFQQRINLHTWPVQTDVREKNTTTLKNRLGMASNAFRILKNTLRFQQYRIKTKVNIYHSCILPFGIIMPWMLKNCLSCTQIA